MLLSISCPHLFFCYSSWQYSPGGAFQGGVWGRWRWFWCIPGVSADVRISVWVYVEICGWFSRRRRRRRGIIIISSSSVVWRGWGFRELSLHLMQWKWWWWWYRWLRRWWRRRGLRFNGVLLVRVGVCLWLLCIWHNVNRFHHLLYYIHSLEGTKTYKLRLSKPQCCG